MRTLVLQNNICMTSSGSSCVRSLVWCSYIPYASSPSPPTVPPTVRDTNLSQVVWRDTVLTRWPRYITAVRVPCTATEGCTAPVYRGNDGCSTVIVAVFPRWWLHYSVQSRFRCRYVWYTRT
jgi:hypothetical protein